MDISRYLQLFLSESREHLARFDEGLSQLLQRPDDSQTINELFRHAHSIKGMSASMGYMPIRNLAHGIEEVLDRVKRSEIRATSELIDSIARGLDRIADLIIAVERSEPIPEDLSPWLGPLAAAASAAVPAQVPAAASASGPASPQAVSGHPAPAAPGPRESPAGPAPSLWRIEILFSSRAALVPARAAVVLKRMEKRGVLHDSDPTFAQLSQEAQGLDAGTGLGDADRFDGRLVAFLETPEPPEALRGELLQLSEIQSVTMTPTGTIGQASAPAISAAKTADPDQANTRAPGAPPPPPSSAADPSKRTLRISVDGLDRFLETVGELIVHRGRLARALEPAVEPVVGGELERLRKVGDRLLREVMAMRMLPFDSIVHRFVRSTRDLGRELSRTLELRITGREVRLDRSMLDELVDPINHILRNCAGHGIEDPDERRGAGKSETGCISISLLRSGDGVTIRIEDDGRGIDPTRIKRHALEGRFITRDQYESISDAEALMLTTIPGFSTAGRVTELSGRGVGMDVVRTTVESLGGKLTIRSVPGQGTAFELTMPLTIAIIKAFLLRAAGCTWAVPLSSVRRTVDVEPEDIDRQEDGCSLSLGEEKVELFDLSLLLSRRSGSGPGGRDGALMRDRRAPQPDGGPTGGCRPALIAACGDRSFGWLVDSILREQDIVVKPLRSPLDELREYAGATVLEDGHIALILDLATLVGAAREALA